MWRLRPVVLCGALWGLVALLKARRDLAKHGTRARIIPVGPLPARAWPGVAGALSRCSATCLERALITQQWLAARGEERDVVIGVPPDGLRTEAAHAWIDGLDVHSPERYAELYRIPVVDPVSKKDAASAPTA